MNHRFFEQKLLQDEAFNAEEERALQEHLLDCADCAALAEVNFALRQVQMATPAEGFSERFSARLAARRKAEKRRYLFGGLILLTVSIAVLVLLASPVISASMASPSRFFINLLSNLAAAFSLMRVMGEVGQVVFRITAGFIPASGWLFTLAFWGGLTFFWLSSLQKANARVQAL